MKKILISDFDGTLYLNKEDLLKNVSLINKFRSEGNLFVIATGRSFNDLKNVLAEVTDEIFYDYLILNHGTVILDNKGLVINQEYIEENLARDIWSVASKYKDYIYEAILYSATKKGIKLGEETVVKALFEIDEVYHEKSVKLYNEVMNQYGEFLSGYILKWEHYEEVEFIPKDVDKTNKIKFLINKENILLDDVYTIGDGINDKRMLEDYKGACMANSVSEISALNLKQYNSVSEFILDVCKTL